MMWINLYLYDTGRLHAGTGVYPSKKVALDKVRHKKRYITTIYADDVTPEGFKESPDGGGFYKGRHL